MNLIDSFIYIFLDWLTILGKFFFCPQKFTLFTTLYLKTWIYHYSF